MIAEFFIAFALAQSTPAASTPVASTPAESAPAAVSATTPRILQVGTTTRRPYSWQQSDGTWTGPAIQLWDKIAKGAGLQYQLKGYTSEELSSLELNSYKTVRSIDVFASGVEINAVQNNICDFSQPFDAGGYSLVTHTRGVTLPRTIIKRVMTFDVLVWLIFMLIATVISGSVIRLVEKKNNPAHFANKDSFVNGLWWAISTLSTVGYGDFVPKTRAGKLVGGIWIFISIILVAIFSATIVATLTVGQLTPYFKSIKSMKSNLVGIIERPNSRYVANKLGVMPRIYITPDDAFAALESNEIEGFLHPTNELRSLLSIRGDSQLLVLPTEVIRGFVGFGLNKDLDIETVRKINSELIKIIESPEWIDTARAMDDPQNAKDSN
jgi:ABC-type amino acid transport substrate-binding protein